MKLRRRLVWGCVAVLLALYAALAGAMLAAMHKPPGEFARFVSRLPGPVVFLLLPFETLWNIARAGPLQVGDPAPDFDLALAGSPGRVRLSSFRGDRPVVLVFGSYT